MVAKTGSGATPCLILAVGALCTASASSDSLQAVSQANNLFSSQFYDVLRESRNDNLIVSPISVSTVLAMLQAGAGGETKKTIRSTLHFPDDEQLNSGYRSLLQHLASNEEMTLELVNRIYPAEDIQLNPQFTNTLKTYYAAEPQQLNYAAGNEAARIINSFVSNATHGKIGDLVSPDALTSKTRLSLINAIYFKGSWEDQFSVRSTTKDDFYVSENEQPIKVDMMRRQHRYILYADIPELDACAVSLPYKGGRASMLILLPNNRFGLATMEAKLKNFTVENIVDRLTRNYVQLHLPRFKIESTIDLQKPLSQLGVGEIFSVEKADLSGISGEKLFVNKAVQKAFIEINEYGSEAAAATSVKIRQTSVPQGLRRQVHANHPFLALIVTNRVYTDDGGNGPYTNNVLFYARVKSI